MNRFSGIVDVGVLETDDTQRRFLVTITTEREVDDVYCQTELEVLGLISGLYAEEKKHVTVSMPWSIMIGPLLDTNAPDFLSGFQKGEGLREEYKREAVPS